MQIILRRCLQSEGYTRIHLPGPHCEFMHEFWVLFCTCRPLTCPGANQLWLCPSLYDGCCDCATKLVNGCSFHSKPHFWEVLHGRYSLLCGPYSTVSSQILHHDAFYPLQILLETMGLLCRPQGTRALGQRRGLPICPNK